RGRFRRSAGTLHVPGTDFSRASLDGVIDASRLDTGEADRHAHLPSVHFFAGERFPELAVRSQTATEDSSDQVQVAGVPTIKGVTREVELDVEILGQAKDPWGNERAAFSATTSVDRREFGLTWNQALETGGVMVGDRIEITIVVEAVRQTAT